MLIYFKCYSTCNETEKTDQLNELINDMLFVSVSFRNKNYVNLVKAGNFDSFPFRF